MAGKFSKIIFIFAVLTTIMYVFMRKIILFISFVLVGLNMLAVKPVYDFLRGETSINLEIDYSKGEYMGMTLDDFIAYRNEECLYTQVKEISYADHWEDSVKPELQSELLDDMRDHLRKIRVCVINCDCKYTLLITVLLVSGNGDLETECSFVDKEGNVVKKFNLNSKGGHFGSIENLMEDGFENLGELLGKKISRAFPE